MLNIRAQNKNICELNGFGLEYGWKIYLHPTSITSMAREFLIVLKIYMYNGDKCSPDMSTRVVTARVRNMQTMFCLALAMVNLL